MMHSTSNALKSCCINTLPNYGEQVSVLRFKSGAAECFSSENVNCESCSQTTRAEKSPDISVCCSGCDGPGLKRPWRRSQWHGGEEELKPCISFAIVLLLSWQEDGDSITQAGARELSAWAPGCEFTSIMYKLSRAELCRAASLDYHSEPGMCHLSLHVPYGFAWLALQLYLQVAEQIAGRRVCACVCVWATLSDKCSVFSVSPM